MNRRDWLRRAALIATGAVAADQLELLERLTSPRVFSSIDMGENLDDYMTCGQADALLEAIMRGPWIMEPASIITLEVINVSFSFPHVAISTLSDAHAESAVGNTPRRQVGERHETKNRRIALVEPGWYPQRLVDRHSRGEESSG